MKRFFGMMPSDEIEIEVQYKDENDRVISIQAGIHGWSIIYADGSSNFKDIDATSEENFNFAYNIATKALGNLTKIENDNFQNHKINK